jgi:hypothetical protein
MFFVVFMSFDVNLVSYSRYGNTYDKASNIRELNSSLKNYTYDLYKSRMVLSIWEAAFKSLTTGEK